jgi:hypothetical protein
MMAGLWASALVALVISGAVFVLLWADRERTRLGWVLVGSSGLIAGLVMLERYLLRPAIGGALLSAGDGSTPRGLIVLGGALMLGVVLRVMVLVLVARVGQLGCPVDGALFGAQIGAIAGCTGVLLRLLGGGVSGAGSGVLMTLASAASTALLGLLFGSASLTARRGVQVGRVIGGIFAAALLELALFAPFADGLGHAEAWVEVVGELSGLLALVGVFYVGFRAERSLLSEELSEEVTARVLPPWVMATIPFYFTRANAGWWERADERRALSTLLVTLAFRKRRLRTLHEDQAQVYALEVGRLRQRARVLLAEGSAESVGDDAGLVR